MSWARLDDGFDEHPKVLALLEHEQGLAAVGLWALCLTYAHRNTLRKGKTPGLIPISLPRRYVGPAGRELAGLLVKEGLWQERCEGDGWLIHDFDRYLPTKQTSEARAAAGKRGAEARWAKTRNDGNEPSDDSKLPSEPDGEPSSCQDDDGKRMADDGNAEANDGSRAPARRAIPKGIAPRLPTPVQPSAAPNESRQDAELTITQRSKRLTDAYAKAEPMCKWPAVNAVVIRAIKTEKWSDEEIEAALLRMAAENRSVTIDSLRTELGGLPPLKDRAPSNGHSDQRGGARQKLATADQIRNMDTRKIV